MKAANARLVFIARGFENRNRDDLLKLYRVLVGPHLEPCVQFWNTYVTKDVLAMEAVQFRFTRVIPGMAGPMYYDRIDQIG